VACSRSLAKLKAGFESRKLIPSPITKTYTLEEAAHAYKTVARGDADGKVVLMMR
jgi:D-arabinose 1-dehydrogenase-like Zn-dependent alcohol dehydrogenase